MRVTIRTFARLRELSTDFIEVELAPDAIMADAWDVFVTHYPPAAGYRASVVPARNSAQSAWDASLAEGDEIAFLPPVSGGASPVGLSELPIDVAALEQVVSRRHGAIVTFVGRARDHADDGREVVELEYEAYAPMAERVLAELAAETERRWTDCRVAVVHRVGRVAIGEAAVVIVTAAPHRADAYAANRHVIEAIKDRLPIWKRERFRDGSEWKRPGA